jgi:hypothetical protein
LLKQITGTSNKGANQVAVIGHHTKLKS